MEETPAPAPLPRGGTSQSHRQSQKDPVTQAEEAARREHPEHFKAVEGKRHLRRPPSRGEARAKATGKAKGPGNASRASSQEEHRSTMYSTGLQLGRSEHIKFPQKNSQPKNGATWEGLTRRGQQVGCCTQRPRAQLRHETPRPTHLQPGAHGDATWPGGVFSLPPPTTPRTGQGARVRTAKKCNSRQRGTLDTLSGSLEQATACADRPNSARHPPPRPPAAATSQTRGSRHCRHYTSHLPEEKKNMPAGSLGQKIPISACAARVPREQKQA
jgi:hypothetical protein